MQHNTPNSEAHSMKISRKEQKNLESNPGSNNKWLNGLVKQVLYILSLPSLHSKLIVPYVLLSLLLTLFGVFILTRLVTSSIRERFLNQLYESSRVASDGIILKEREHIENLRSMAFTVGVATALLNHDANKLETLLLPLAINTQTQILTLVDLSGKEVLTLGFDSSSGQYQRVSGKDFLTFSPVKSILNGEVDEKGDKFSALLETKNGVALFTGTPVHNSDGGLTGTLLVATYLQDLASDLKARALADIFFLDLNGNPIATTFPLAASNIESLAQSTRIQVTDQTAPSHKITLFDRGYQAFYAPLLIRGKDIGWLGVLLPDNFIISTEVTSRNSLSLLFTVGTLLILIIGRLLALNISRPILKLRQMTEEVANGNLQQTITLERSDEVGRLAKSFNVMTEHLRERTAEANKLYQESDQRNQELAQINNRLRMAQLQLVQSEKLASIGQLTAGIVHDVKNPLSAIQGMTEMLLEDPNLHGEARQDIDVIYNSSVNANKIITDLLKFARQAPPEVKSCDLRETLNAALQLNLYLIRKADVKLALEIPEQPVIAVHDPQQVEQVLINLIQNAIQAMPQGGNLCVELEQVDETARIRLQDTGIGISPENMKRIFDPFFTTKSQGTGLGLSTSYGIISAHQGEIRVESVLGEGTCFTIILPMKPELVINGDGEEITLVV